MDHSKRDTSVTQNRYIINPVPDGLSPTAELVFVWREGTRGDLHIKAWHTKIEREFPELFDAIQSFVGAVEGDMAEEITEAKGT